MIILMFGKIGLQTSAELWYPIWCIGGDMLSKSNYRGFTPARQAANRKYDDKTYKRYHFMLRLEEDAEIIKDIEDAKEHGINKREWLNALFYGTKK